MDEKEVPLAVQIPHIVNSKQEKQFRNLSRYNQTLNEVELINYTPCTLSDVVQIYRTKVSKKEQTIIDPGVLEKKYSPYEVMFMLLLRLSQRFTPDEVKYLEEQHQVPLLATHQDGAKGKWMSIMSCQKLIKAWKKNRTDKHPIMTDQQINELDRVATTLGDEANNLEENVFYLYFTPSNVTTLPFMVGCLKIDKVGDLAYHPCVFTIDSAASSSILPLKLFKKLGYKMDEIDRSQTITVATACSTDTKALGFYQSKIYIRGQN